MSEPNSIENKESFLKKGARVSSGFFKGRRAHNINQRFNKVARIDKAHKRVNYKVDPKISSIKDVHLPVPPGGLEACTEVAKVSTALNTVNRVALPLAIVVDTARTGYSIYEDCKNDSTRNTVETVSNIAGGWGGGFGGAVGGAALGSVILPGVGTIIGGLIGGIGGGIGGSIGVSKLTKKVGDKFNYDVVEKTCKTCEMKFKIRKYRGEDCDQENCLICNQFLNSFRINDDNEDKLQDNDQDVSKKVKKDTEEDEEPVKEKISNEISQKSD